MAARREGACHWTRELDRVCLPSDRDSVATYSLGSRKKAEESSVKITSVKTAATSGHCMHLWVRIETDAGVAGLGECVHGGHQAIAIIQELAAKLVGRDPFAVDAIFEDLR